jgi:outer membrane protein OmpA-like peptidoglycan-associated protein
MKKLFIPIILFIGISVNLFAQEKSSKEIQADKFFFRYSFERAIQKYKKAGNLTIEGKRHLAASYQNLGQNPSAESVYSKLMTEPTGILPEDYYNYAMVLKSNSKYELSDIWMNKFANAKPNDLRAKSYVANKGEFANIFNNKGTYQIHTLTVNSNSDDFGTCYYKNKIVFSSTKSVPKMIRRRYNWNGKPFWNLNVSEVENGQLKTSQLFDKKLNSKFHDGPASFCNDGNFIAFTRNNNHDKSDDRVVELQIWFSSNKDGKWSKPEPFIFNNKEYSVGQPCLTADGNTMYFTSDMTGGFGGSDLYKTTKDGNGIWQKPENLGNKINTEGDEMFPFLEEKSGTMYFTSNGHYGLGGLDIFTATLTGGQFDNVKNAGYPLNTQNDDFAAIVNDKMSAGYISSNRVEGSGGDDIYSFDIIKAIEKDKKIQGIAKDKISNPLPDVIVELKSENGNTIASVTTEKDGEYTFLVETDKNYKLVGKKEKFLEGTNSANTFGKELIVKADVVLLQKEEIIVQEKPVEVDLAIALPLNSIYFDLDKYNVRPDAAIELDKIVKTMNEFPDMVVLLKSYTDCRETVEYNQILSDKRANASAVYIQTRITNPSRITGKGYSESKLVNGCACEGDVVSDCTEADHQQNRRTEFIIVTNLAITNPIK